MPEADAHRLADAIARLLRDPALAQGLGQAARARALAEHGKTLMRERYDALLIDAISTEHRLTRE